MPKRAVGQAGKGVTALPTTQVTINGFLVSDALLDSGSQLSLIDSRVFSVVAPNSELTPPARLVSASGHQLNVLGSCTLPVAVDDERAPCRETQFTVVHDLSHNVVLGWDFLTANSVIMNCSARQVDKIKVRSKKPVSVPPRSAVCLSVKIDTPLVSDAEYLFVGQQSNDIEICDSLIKPFAETEIPIYVRNRSERTITIHRRSVIGYIERVEHVEPKAPEPAERGDAAEVNAVSADDGRFVGKSTDDVLAEFMVGEPLSASQRDKLASLLSSFPEVFSRGYADIGVYKGGEVELELQSGVRPQFVRPYPVPWAREEQLRAQLNELQSCGVIEAGEPAEWNSPIILVPKGKNSREFRIVQDMRCLNKCLVPKTFVFPNIDEFIFSLHGWRVASSLDIKHAFWNLRLSEESSKICAFYALGKTFYPRRMPMGCMQSSYFLHLAMHKVLGDIPGVHIYADDVLLTSASVEEHYALLHTVLDRLRSAGMKVAPDKCRLFQTRLTYLGHEITPNGVGIDPDRVRIIKDLTPPKTVREAKRIFGMFSWFRKFIPSFTDMVEPLVILCNSEKFFWNAELDKCFSALKDALMSDKVLSYPRRDGQFILYTDSSTTGSGQILCQLQDGEERVIAYSGNRYSRAQRKWTIFELEVFSFIQGLKKFYRYLAGKSFTWVCDCKSALQILNNQDLINPRLVRWRAFVGQFLYTVEHRRAVRMQHVDTLSRLYESETAGEPVDGHLFAGKGRSHIGIPSDNGRESLPVVPDAGASEDVHDVHWSAGPSAGCPPGTAPSAGEASANPPPAGLESDRGPDGGASGGGIRRHPPVSPTSGRGRPPETRSSGETESGQPPVDGGNGEIGRHSPVGSASEHPSDVGVAGGTQGVSNHDHDETKCSKMIQGETAREVNLTFDDTLVKLSLKPESLAWYQRHDKNCRAIAHRLNHGKWPRFASPVLRRQRIADFFLKDGILYRRSNISEHTSLIVWPVAKRFEVLFNRHDVSHHAHGGADKMYEQIRKYIWYPGLKSDCHDYVRSCTNCSQKKDTRSQFPPLLPQPSAYPNETLVIDVLSMPRGHIHSRSSVLTCVDKFSGFLSVYPLDSGSSDSIIEALTQHFLTFGPPERIESDAGTNLLKNSHVQTLCDHFGISTRSSVGYHHEAVGKVERRHLDIKRRLRAVSDCYGTDWEQRLQGIVYALNNETCDTHGYTPYFLYFLRHPHCALAKLARAPRNQYSDCFVHEKLRLMSSTLQQAQARQERKASEYKQQYDRRRQVQDCDYKPGDRLWVRNFRIRSKLDNPWIGPFVVVTSVGRRHIDYMNKKGVIRRTHVKNTKRLNERRV